MEPCFTFLAGLGGRRCFAVRSENGAASGLPRRLLPPALRRWRYPRGERLCGLTKGRFSKNVSVPCSRNKGDARHGLVDPELVRQPRSVSSGEVDPVSWTPERSPRWRRRDHPTHLNSVADGRAGPRRPLPGGTGAGVRTDRAVDQELGRPSRVRRRPWRQRADDGGSVRRALWRARQCGRVSACAQTRRARPVW
jgi:hypothetical protein